MSGPVVDRFPGSSGRKFGKNLAESWPGAASMLGFLMAGLGLQI